MYGVDQIGNIWKANSFWVKKQCVVSKSWYFDYRTWQGKICIVNEFPHMCPNAQPSHVEENVSYVVLKWWCGWWTNGWALACIDECFLVSRRIWYCSMVQHLSYNLWNASLGIISLLRSCFTNVTICSNSFTHIPKRVGKDGHTWTFFWVLRIVIKFE
mgnify:CR=1 FL=1